MLRFPSPLIEPDVTISVIRLSDGFHLKAWAAGKSMSAWPSRRALVGASGSFRELPGSRQSPTPRLVRTHPQPGLLPSPSVTWVHRSYEPLRLLPSPLPDEAFAQLPTRPEQVSRVANHRVCVRAAPTTPASRTTVICRCIWSSSTAFVHGEETRRSHQTFRGLLRLHACCGPYAR
jgi:hypothetical protein